MRVPGDDELPGTRFYIENTALFPFVNKHGNLF